jgi:hypothetical protein
MPVSGQLERLARATRVSGIVTVGIGLLTAFGTAVIVAVRTDEGWALNGWRLLILVAFLIAAYLIPGALLWWLGRRLDSGRHGAFVPILVVSILHFAVLLFSREFAILVVGIAVRLPTAYVLAMWINALPEYRDHRRQVRRAGQRNGFSAEPASSQARPAPPPAARSIPIPRPSLRR